MAIEVQPSLSPHLCVDGAAAAIDFYVKAFNAVELGRVPGPDGKLVHAALQINGSTVLLNDDFPEYNDGKSIDADRARRHAGHHPPDRRRCRHEVPAGPGCRRHRGRTAGRPVLG